MNDQESILCLLFVINNWISLYRTNYNLLEIKSERWKGESEEGRSLKSLSKNTKQTMQKIRLQSNKKRCVNCQVFDVIGKEYKNCQFFDLYGICQKTGYITWSYDYCCRWILDQP